MPPSSDSSVAKPEAGFAALRRFLPYLWPADRPGLKLRVVVAMVLVLGAKAINLLMPFTYSAAINHMTHGADRAVSLAIALVVAYAAARFGGVLFDNLRNAIFERVGQEAARRLALEVFAHLHRLSLRFHLERRTGALTKVVERGTKSIDTMLYFLLFNIAPTIFELTAVCVIFFVKFGGGLVVATGVMVAVYIVFTQRLTNWRIALRREWTRSDSEATQKAVDSAAQLRDGQIFRRRGGGGTPLRRKRAPAGRHHHQGGDEPRLDEYRPELHHQPDDGRRDGLQRVGVERRALFHRRRGVREHDAGAAVPPARLSRHGLSRDPPGADRHGGDVRPRRHARGGGRRRPTRHRSCPGAAR